MIAKSHRNNGLCKNAGVQSRLRSLILRGLTALLIGLSVTPVMADAISEFDQALAQYKNKLFDLSADQFGEFVRRYPAHERRPLADLYLGQSLMQLRRFGEARQVFTNFLLANPNHADHALALYREAECAFFLGEFRPAANGFQNFLTRYPEIELAEWASHYLGESRLQLEEADLAAQAFQNGITKFPKGRLVNESRFGLARAFTRSRQFDKAIEAYQEISADTTNARAADALFNLGTLQFDNRNYAEAAKAFSTLSKNFPEYRQLAAAELNTGYSYYYLNQFDDAVQAFDRAAKSDSDRLTARLWAGLSRRKQGQFEEAIKINREAYEEFKNDPAAARLLYYQADCEYRLKRYAEAIALFTRFADLYPNNEFTDDSLHYAVEASLNSGNLAQAIQLHQRFEREFPPGRTGLTMLECLVYGRILLARAEADSPQPPLTDAAQADLRTAADLFERVARESTIERTSNWATLLLARTRFKQGDYQGTIAAAQIVNNRLEMMEKEADRQELLESLYLTGKAAVELKNWAVADQSFEKYASLSKDPANRTAAVTQMVLARVNAGKLDQLDALWSQLQTSGSSTLDLAKAIRAAAEQADMQQRFADSALLFEKLESLDDQPDYQAIARSGLGHARYNLQQYPVAAEAFDRLIKSPPADQPLLLSDAAFMKGLSLESARQPKEAAAAYESGALLIAGKDGQIGPPPADEKSAWNAYRCLKHAAVQYERLNEIVKADALYRQAWEYLKQLPPARRGELDKLLYQWAIANHTAARYDQADDLFRQILQDHPGSSLSDQATFYLTDSLIQSGKLEQAESELKRILEDPKTDIAIRPEILHKLIELTADREGWKETVAYSSKLIEEFPASGHRLNARYRQAEAALKTGELESARKQFSDLRQDIINDESAARGDVAEGTWILSAEVAMATMPPDYEVVDVLAQDFHTRFPMSEFTPQLDYIHGRSLIKRAEFDKARTVLQTIADAPDAARSETAAKADFLLADSYLMTKKEDDVSKAYARFFTISEKYNVPDIQAAALLKGAECQAQMGRKDESVETYQRLNQRFPESPFAAQARERLKVMNIELKPAAPAGGTTVPSENLPVKPETAPGEAMPASPRVAPESPAPANPTPANPTPANPTPANPTPASDAPKADMPAQTPPAKEEPGKDKPAEEKPAGEKPAGEKPAGDAPAKPVPAPIDPKPAEPTPASPKPEPPAPISPAPESSGSNQPTAADTPASKPVPAPIGPLDAPEPEASSAEEPQPTPAP